MGYRWYTYLPTCVQMWRVQDSLGWTIRPMGEVMAYTPQLDEQQVGDGAGTRKPQGGLRKAPWSKVPALQSWLWYI